MAAVEISQAGGATDEGLHRGLNQRQLTMIAIGGAIGVGLFLGSTFTISLAGPGVILTYVLGAVIALIMAYALAEMAVVHPTTGSFGVYAERYLSPWLGFAVRASYAFIQVLAIGAEVTAVAIYFGFWFPTVAQWIWVAAASIGLLLINTSRVSRFGEFEYWFALIKVAAIVAFIVIGLWIILGFGPLPAAGIRNLVDGPGGFLPHGWTGVWLALTLVITSYMGVEVIAITAGEAQHPEQSIPRAMRTMVLRLILFYLLAISVMLMMTPWDQIAGARGGITGSPFVRAFTAVGIPYAAGAMNLVVISAALSSANTNLYTTTRMLFSLSRSGFVPAWVSAVSPTGVPIRALVVASAGMALAILLAIFSPDVGFLALYGTAVAGMLFIWIVILLTYLRFRASLSPERVSALPIRLPAHKVAAVFGIVMLVAIAGTTFFVEGLRYTVPSFLPFLLVISIFYARNRSRASRPRP
jgi:AAT family amino acid transporter